jgi:drug/metabolite transporter (DMT)-like permease
MTNTFLYIATLAIWGPAFYAISLQLGAVPVEWSIAYRFGFGALVFFAFAAATKRKIRFSARDHLAFTAMGVFLFGLHRLGDGGVVRDATSVEPTDSLPAAEAAFVDAYGFKNYQANTAPRPCPVIGNVAGAG